jgi:hypothetical protein
LKANTASKRAEKESLSQKLPAGIAKVINQSRKAAGTVSNSL